MRRPPSGHPARGSRCVRRTSGRSTPLKRPARRGNSPRYVFFASDADSSFIMGDVLAVMGGRHDSRIVSIGPARPMPTTASSPLSNTWTRSNGRVGDVLQSRRGEWTARRQYERLDWPRRRGVGWTDLTAEVAPRSRRRIRRVGRRSPVGLNDSSGTTRIPLTMSIFERSRP
jgi:hypothetical protein